MTTALRDVSEHLLPGLDQAGWEKFGRIFTHETTHFYDRYLAGELTSTSSGCSAAGRRWGTSASNLAKANRPTTG